MIDDAGQSAGSLETRADAGKGPAGTVRLWLEAIELARKEEKDWRDAATKVLDRYKDEKERKGRRYNILYSNVQVLKPSLYSRQPTPDVRRRFKDKDPVGMVAAQVMERALSYSLDAYDFDHAMKAAVHDRCLTGRGVTRVRLEPVLDEDGQPIWESVQCEAVQWDDFVRGPGRTWKEVQWVAFQHRLSRDELDDKFDKAAVGVQLDWSENGAEKKDGHEPSDLFKRAIVWEVWDRQQKQVVWIAPSQKEKPLRIDGDLLGLRDFFPMPRPLYAVDLTDSLVPIEDYRYYKDQAEELDRITRRITSLIEVLKWRGVRDASISEWEKISTAEDGDLVPSEGARQLTASGRKLEDSIYLMPIESVIKVLQGLYQQREQVKMVIFEIVGIADIMRGSSDPNETLGAQELKAQWGSGRLQPYRADVQRFARDLIRIMAELIAEKFQPQTLTAMTGITLVDQPDQQTGQTMPNPVMAMLRSDALRGFNIDIETDSTIQPDLLQAQKYMSAFVQGFGQFVKAIGPAVQSGFVKLDVAADILTGFARNFKLGKQAEDAIERIGEQEPPPPQGEGTDPAAMADAKLKEQELQGKAIEAKARLDLDTRKQQADETFKAREVSLSERKLALEERKLALDERKQAAAEDEMEGKFYFEGAKIASEGEQKTADREMQERMNARMDEGEDEKPEKEKANGVDPEMKALLAGMTAAITKMSGPRKLLRGKDGKLEGVD